MLFSWVVKTYKNVFSLIKSILKSFELYYYLKNIYYIIYSEQARIPKWNLIEEGTSFIKIWGKY